MSFYHEFPTVALSPRGYTQGLKLNQSGRRIKHVTIWSITTTKGIGGGARVAIFEHHGKRLTGLTAPSRDIARIMDRFLVEKDSPKDAADEYLGFASGRLTVTHAQSLYRLPNAVTS